MILVIDLPRETCAGPLRGSRDSIFGQVRAEHVNYVNYNHYNVKCMLLNAG